MKLTKKSERLGHEGSIYQLQALAKGAGFLSVAGDGWLVHWPPEAAESGKLLAKVESGQLLCAAQLAEGGLVAGDLSGGLHWLYPYDPGQNRHLAHHTKGVFALQLVADQLFTAGGAGFLSRWSVSEARVAESLPLSNQSLRSLAYLPEQDLLAVGSSDHRIYLVRASNMELLHYWPAHQNSVFSLAFSPDGRYLISGGRDAMLNVTEIDSYAPIAQLAAHNFTINDLAFSPDGRFLATASRDKTFKIWDAKNWQLLKVAETIRDKGHINSVNTLCWLDKQTVITAGDDRKIIEWEIR